MILGPFKPPYRLLIWFVFACLLPLAAHGNKEEAISEKRIGVAMRMIGHEVLLCLGDQKSRVLPIEKMEEHYKIPFEFEFSFDPDDIISIVNQVMAETGVAKHYVVEVEHCNSQMVVHSFEVNHAVNRHLITCEGRIVPEDCYSLLVTILDGLFPATNAENSTPTDIAAKGVNTFKASWLLLPLLLLIIGIVYFFQKRKLSLIDPNLVLIGASEFDTRNMTLSFDNKMVDLSHKEAELLSVLHTSANAPVAREVILQRVWGDDGDYVGRTLDVFISKLRKKLEADSSVKIINIRGVGYKLIMDVPS